LLFYQSDAGRVLQGVVRKITIEESPIREVEDVNAGGLIAALPLATMKPSDSLKLLDSLLPVVVSCPWRSSTAT
ncbi:hypothetical protein, partial [Thermococcus sp.]|uniref:hypothetical protein n=1 Tax=Thermococcus sp. TaxID=35749 RepID=UPI002611F807